MIEMLSRATTYLTTYFVDASTGELKERSRATGFFVRLKNKLLLVTNWHVVSGLNPSDTSKAADPPPHVVKATLHAKSNALAELTLPLYSSSLEPLWHEHPKGPKVDLAVYPLELQLEKYFHFVDIQSAVGENEIAESVGKDAFIIGYPFNSAEMRLAFGEDVPYYVPIWKRGSIATEPAMRLGKHVLLIDSLSRPGMSGAPVVIAEDARVMQATTKDSNDVMARILAGDTKAILDLDHKAVANKTLKKFRFLGVYSGVIGNTRLQEVALGQCWHADILRELIENPQDGKMPHHGPLPNDHLEAYLGGMPPRNHLVYRGVDGSIVADGSM